MSKTLLILLCALATFVTRSLAAAPVFQLHRFSKAANNTYPRPFSLTNLAIASRNLALEHCQQLFQWRRWNCPTADFDSRRYHQPEILESEDVLVTSMSAAAALYILTKDCSAGRIAECGCKQRRASNSCPDNPQASMDLLYSRMNANFTKDFHGRVKQHNHDVLMALMRSSVFKQSNCISFGTTGCAAEERIDRLIPFSLIAKAVRRLYDRSRDVSEFEKNNTLMVDGKNLTFDSFLHTRKSPSYCVHGVIPSGGTLLRVCSVTSASGVTYEEPKSCQHLCLECGYKVSQRKIGKAQHCNCRLIAGFGAHCDVCNFREQQKFCDL